MNCKKSHEEENLKLSNNMSETATPKDENYYRGKLFAAAWRGEFDLVKEVLDAKVVSVNVVDSDGVSDLRFAAQYGHLEITKYLLERGADPNLRAKDGLDPLLSAIDYGHLEIVEVLLSHGADVRTKTKETNAVLLAREKGRRHIEEVLIAAGATDNMGLLFKIRKRLSKTFRIKG
jgi:ankyrin repeat protein